MKNLTQLPLLILALTFILSGACKGQEIELKLDSLNNKRWPTIVSSGETRPQVQIQAYSYDSLDRRIQSRILNQRPDNPDSRRKTDIYYLGDTIISTSMIYFNSDSLWHFASRNTRYPQGDTIITLIESYQNDEWSLLSKRENVYNANGDGLSSRGYNWLVGEYVATGGSDHTYNDDDFELSYTTFRYDDQGEIYVTLKDLRVYDDNNNLKKFQKYELEGDTLFKTREATYNYNVDGTLKDLLSLSFTPLDTFRYKAEWSYPEEGIIEGYDYYGNNWPVWELSSKSISYESPKTIGDDIDSSFVYPYDAEADSFELHSRNYYSYEEYATGKVLFHYVLELYDDEEKEWKLAQNKEEFFHYTPLPPSSVAETELTEPLILFPNPAGNIINLKIQTAYTDLSSYKKARIFSINGQDMGTHKIHMGKIDISELSPGCYVVQLQIGDALHSIKFIKAAN